MSRPLPVKSFSLSVCLTSSPINWEECPLSLHWCLFVSPLHPLRPFLSVCPSLFSSLSNSIFVRVLPFFLSLSISRSLPLCLLEKKDVVSCIFLNQREREREGAVGALMHRADSWFIEAPVERLVDHRPFILLSGHRPFWLAGRENSLLSLKKKSLKNPITCFFFYWKLNFFLIQSVVGFRRTNHCLLSSSY